MIDDPKRDLRKLLGEDLERRDAATGGKLMAQRRAKEFDSQFAEFKTHVLHPTLVELKTLFEEFGHSMAIGEKTDIPETAAYPGLVQAKLSLADGQAAAVVFYALSNAQKLAIAVHWTRADGSSHTISGNAGTAFDLAEMEPWDIQKYFLELLTHMLEEE